VGLAGTEKKKGNKQPPWATTTTEALKTLLKATAPGTNGTTKREGRKKKAESKGPKTTARRYRQNKPMDMVLSTR